jgi:heptaprenyl diphosphate synthase
MGKCNLDAFVTIAPELTEVDAYLEQCFEEYPCAIKEGLNYMLRAGGKRLRPAFVILASRYGNKRGWLAAACAMELVHMVSLVHDDVIDASDLRRGKDTLRKRYGDYFAVHFGDFLFAKALALLESYRNEELSKRLACTSFGMCRAEIEQLVHEHSNRQSLKGYFSRIKKKTAQLMSLSLQTGAIVGGVQAETANKLGKYGHYLGLAFQISDDLLDYIADEQTIGKPVGADLQQGLTTLPLLYFYKIACLEDRRRVEELLQKKSLNRAEREAIRQVIQESGALSRTKATVNRYVLKALHQLEGLPENSATETLRQVAAFYYIS